MRAPKIVRALGTASLACWLSSGAALIDIGLPACANADAAPAGPIELPPGMPPGFGPPPVVVSEIILVSTRRISRSVFEYTYQAYVSNWDDHDVTAAATLAIVPPNVSIVDGSLDIGVVVQGDTVKSADSFTIRHDRSTKLDADQLLWNVQAIAAELATYELIDQGVTNGEINDETALLYKVFADFSDERLPQQYRGRDDLVGDGRALDVAARLLSGLSQATQDLLAPFFMRPDEAGSWVEVQAGNAASPASALRQASAAAPSVRVAWSRIPVMINGDAKAWVWWMHDLRPTDEARAEMLATELENYLWDKLTTALRVPVSDDQVQTAGNPPQPNPRPHGPDGLLDIYLTGLRGRPIAAAATDNCDGSPVGTYILLSTWAGPTVVAHELTHAIVASYPLAGCVHYSYHWMNEATATWAEHFAYDDGRVGIWDTEQAVAPAFLRKPLEKPWDPASIAQLGKCHRLNPAEPDTGESLNLDEELCGNHQYGAYLWFLNLTQARRASAADAAPVNFTWLAAATKLPIRAIDAVGGGFDTNWPTFLANNWNRVASEGNPHRAYFTWDELESQAYEQFGAPIQVTLPIYWNALYPVFHQLPPLAAQYDHFDFSSDPTIRQVWYYNDYAGSGTGSDPRADVRAIVKVQGQWKQAANWSGDRKRVFCRDNPAEDIQELVLILSNRDVAGASDPTSITKLGGPGTQTNSPIRLVYSPVPCHDWVGSVSFRDINASENGDTITTTANAMNIRFRFDPANSDPFAGNSVTSFQAVTGNVDWEIDYAISGCSGVHFSNSFFPSGKLSIGPTGSAITYYLANESDGSSDAQTMDCGGEPIPFQETFSQWVPFPTSDLGTLMDVDTIEGGQVGGNSPGDGWIWRFTKP